jgi:hypothetical protein
VDNIIVLDSIMGSGKTTYMLNYLNEVQAIQDEDPFDGLKRRFLYVTPTLAEVDRVTAHCPTLRFHDPEPIHGRKLWDLGRLIAEGRNVCTTHALFSMLTREIYDLLRERNYTLVIDEVVTCVDLLRSLRAADRKMLFDGDYVRIGDRNHLVWNHARYPDYRGRFDDIRNLCDNGNLVAYGRNPTTGLPTVLIWEFPADFLRCFEQVYILTYLFYGSPMLSYFKAEGLDFTMNAVREGQLICWQDSDEGAIKAKLRDLITIYTGPMNSVGDPQPKSQPLSATWFERESNDDAVRRLRQSTINFFERIAATPSVLNAWTTFKDARSRLKGYGYARGFISLGTKATNDHIAKRSMAYLANIFHQPVIKGFFKERGIHVYEEMHALSEMIQWIWRSGIRRGDPITVFVPSKRMRDLLNIWLDADNAAGLLWSTANQADAEIRHSQTSA